VAGPSPWRRRPGAAQPATEAAPPRLAACARAGPVPCYARDPLHEVYGTGALYARGITGAGTTIAVIMPEASAGVAGDLAVFSRHFRLPPARLEVLSWDHARPGSARDPDAGGWDQEWRAYAGFPAADP